VGLDGVEFLLATEEAFQIAIPDEDAVPIMTPRNVVDYVLRRLGEADERVCLEQRAFYRLRSACIRLFRVPRGVIKPESPWTEILPPRARRHNWKLLHQATGTPQWPVLGFWGRFPAGIQTVGGTARFLASEATAALKGNVGWSRHQVEEVVTKLMRDQLGIKEFGWDQHFVRDLGVD
jgi:hypothetical protein